MLANYQNKKKGGGLHPFLLHAGGILVIGILLVLIIANIKIYKKRQEFLSQVSILQNQIQDIKKRNSDLKQGIENADNIQYIEKIARQKLDLQKHGEQVVSFTMPPSQDQKTGGKQNFTESWLGWLGNAWRWIKSRF